MHAKSATAKSLSYLGVYEPGTPPGYRPVCPIRSMAGRKPNLVGYYSGWAEPFNDPFADMVHRARRHPVHPDRPQSLPLSPRSQRTPTTATSARTRTASAATAIRRHRLRARDECHMVPLGIRPRPARDVRGRLAAHRDNIQGQGAQNVTWLWTINQDLPGSGRSPRGGPVLASHLGRH